MKPRQWLSIKSTLCLTVGLFFVLAPGVPLAYFGVPNIEPSGLFFMARSYGAILFLLGLTLWLSRSLSDQDVLRVIVPPIVIGDAIGLGVAVIGQVTGMMNSLGWFVIAYFLLSMLGFAAWLFPKRVSPSQVS